MTDQQLMAKIQADMGAAIADAVRGTAIPPYFVAALVANESSGDPTVKRFEPAVLGALAEVLASRRAAFGSITKSSLSVILMNAGIKGDPIASVVSLLLDFSTSWGPTQIMGYQSIGRGVTPGDLQILPQHFTLCVKILQAFKAEWHLADGDYESFFRCWNTGRATGQTTDPDYVAKGFARMQIYRGLPQ